MTRPVYLLRDDIALCEPCIERTADPVLVTRAAIVGRDDGAHCIECDYHVDHDSRCPAEVGISAYRDAIARRILEVNAMSAKDIGCPLSADEGEPGDCGLFDTADDLDTHLTAVHDTTWDLATGTILSQDEVEHLGLDGRDGTGEYGLSDLSGDQRVTLYAFRNREG